jgi:nicotinamidase-related amidase
MARDAMQMNYKVTFVADGNATLTDAEHNDAQQYGDTVCRCHVH